MRFVTIGVYINIILALFTIRHSSAQSSFQLHIGSSCSDWLMAADNDKLGNTIFAGIAEPAGGTSPNSGILVKVRSDGTYIQKTISITDTNIFFRYIKVLENGNYFVISSNKPFSSSQDNMMDVFIFDTAMNVITRKPYLLPEGYMSIDGYCNMVEDNDGNLVLAASLSYKQGTSTFGDFVFYKFNHQGDTLASRIYETWYEADVLSLAKVPNSDQLMMISDGYLPFTAGELMFIDSSLEIVRVKRIQGGSTFYFDTKHWLSDTTFIMTASFIKPREGLPKEYMMRVSVLDTAANYLKSTELNHPDTIEYTSFSESMSYFNDTTIYITGFQSYHDLTQSIPTGVFLYIVDTNLSVRGYKTLGGDHYYDGMGAIETSDGGCLVWATRYNIPHDGNLYDIMIWKVMPEDMTLYTHVSHLPPERIQGHAWPNPVKDELFVSLEDFAQGEAVRYRITDMQGRARLDQKHTVNGNCLHSQTHNLDPGMYIYEVSGIGNKTISGKIIKN